LAAARCAKKNAGYFSSYLREKMRKDSSMKRALTLLALLAALSNHRRSFGQEAVMEEVRVEGAVVSPLDLTNDRAVDLFTRRLLEHGETKRALELQVSNRNPLTTLLSLTSASPIPLGSSENRVDTFFLQNYVRADLNPARENSLFDSKLSQKSH